MEFNFNGDNPMCFYAESDAEGLEEVYANLLGGKVTKKYSKEDNQGIDITFDGVDAYPIQVKSWIKYAVKHLQKGIEMRQIIPCVVGDPERDSADTIWEQIDAYGIYLGPSVQAPEFVKVNLREAYREAIYG
jgi:hypothetical protein